MLGILLSISLGFMFGILAHWLMNKKNRDELAVAIRKILLIKEK